MRNGILDDMTAITKLLSNIAKNIADLEDANQVSLDAAHRSALENQALKEKIAFLEKELTSLQRELLELKAQSKIVKRHEEPTLTPKLSSEDLLFLVTASEVLRTSTTNKATSFSSQQGKKSGVFQQWSEATDFPMVPGETGLKRAKSGGDGVKHNNF